MPVTRWTGAQGKWTCMPLVSSGGASQVKDTGHNGMESIGICLSVLTLSIFLVREIRTDNLPHPSPPPHAHTLQSQAQSHRTAPGLQLLPTKPGPGERRGGRGRKPTPALLPPRPAPTPRWRFLIPRNLGNRDGGCRGEMRCVPDARRQPTSRARPSPTSIQRRLLLGSADEERQCGSATTRAQGTLRGRREAGPKGAGHSHPFPSWGGGGEGSPLREPRRPRSIGGWVPEAASHPPRLG